MAKIATTHNPQAEQKIIYVLTSELESQGQPGRDFDDAKLSCLAASIKKNGFISPITISVNGNRKVILVGERRWKAAIKANVTLVPCLIKSDNASELVLEESVLKSAMPAVKKAEAMKRLVDSGVKQKEIAERFGKKPSTISDIVRLVKLPEYIKAECRNDPTFAIRELKKIADAPLDKQMAMFEHYKEKKNTRKMPSSEESITAAIKLLGDKLPTIGRINDQAQKDNVVNLLRDLYTSIGRIIDTSPAH